MGGEAVIQIENLSKRYLLGATPHRDGLRHHLERSIRRAFRRDRIQDDPQELWALRDVNCRIGHGEVLGIIGRNGAGKSTLLKVLSRITEPTSGRVRLRGRLASLLEVGTGFHPDLTGRENIFLNGAILGMSRAEIRARFDAIVAFAEVERFLDTPVKRYSSGMYVRLAFAVAAHLEPEILVIDEVLAVGDAAFQKKCLGKMSAVSSGEGRTVIFVSHNMAAVRALCTRALYLDSGKVVVDGEPEACIRAYLRESFSTEAVWTGAPTKHPLQITRLRLVPAPNRTDRQVEASEPIDFEVEYEVRSPLSNALVELWLFTEDGTHLMTLGEHDANPSVLERRQPGRYRMHVRIPGNLLNTGAYYLRVNSGIAHQNTFDHVDALRLEVVDSRPDGTRQNRRGHIIPLLPWKTIACEPLNAPAAKTS